MADRNHWLVKSEPGTYSWDDLVRDGSTYWDGVRNYEARNNLRLMKLGDRLLFYHSGKGTEVVGVATVIQEYYQDPTTEDSRWCVVDLAPARALPKPVTLQQIKREPRLSAMQLVRRSRLSVTPVTPDQFGVVLEMGGLADEDD